MSPHLIAVIIDNLINISAGVVAMLIGFRILGPKPTTNLKFDEFYGKYGKHLKWLGAILIIWALINIGIYYHENP